MNFRINTLGRRIGLGYLGITMVLAIAVVLTLMKVRNINEVSSHLIGQRQPSSRACVEMQSGFNHSSAALRGWLLFRKDTFRVERKYVWENEIRIPMTTLENLSTDWNNKENIQLFSKVKPLIDRFEVLQQTTEDLALEDIDSAKNFMQENVLPVYDEIRFTLNKLVDNYEKTTTTDFAAIQSEMNFLNNMEWTLLGVGILISLFLAWYITRSIVKPVSGAVHVAENIGRGDLETVVEVSGSTEMEKLGNALANMRDSLKAKTELAEEYNWLSTGKNKLNESVRGDISIEDFGKQLIRFMAEYTHANIGSIYLKEEAGDAYILTGAYAFDKEAGVERFLPGQGTIGQAVSGRKTIVLSNLQETDIKLRTAITDVMPRNMITAPISFEGEMLAVIELGKMEAFTSKELQFVEANLETIGVILNSALSRKRISDLLAETQVQSEELQQQQEELQQSNEELEEQTLRLKEQQEELQATNEELEEQTQIVEHKNKDLETARTEIELKARQLEISSKYKSEFLANMSHELRTPLNSLLILSNDLAHNKTGNLTEEQVESAEVISKSGADLLNLINEILDLSKIEAGKMDLNLGYIRFSELADNIYRNFRKTAEQKGLQLNVTVDSALPEGFTSDLQRLEQVLKNLLSNALKFTERGQVSVHFEQTAGGYISVSVKDSGIGIPEDKLDVIFEAFQQADGGTSRRYGGTGLGLSISRELAKLLGGRITVESVPGEGSVFVLIIPLASAEPQPKTQGYEAKRPAESLLRSGSRYLNYAHIEDERDEIRQEDHTILIIEDDENFARILGAQAKSRGFRFVAASTGEDGLALAEKYKPVAILLDVDLPGIDGHMVLKELKGNTRLRHIPVHMISVNEKTLDPIKSGAVEYLTKPVSKRQLEDAFSRIENFIDRKMKNLLVIEDDEVLRKSIVKLIGNGDVQSLEVGTGSEAIKVLQSNTVDCIVLDIGLPDMTGFELLKKLEALMPNRIPPVIVYTGKELSRKENDELRQYAETIIVKGVKSEERLLDETALFLHRTVKNLPMGQQQMIEGLYNKESVFQGRKVLLVDDDMRNIFALSKVLKEQGLEVIKADNGRIALECLETHDDIDLVLMDIMMPEMDGYECMREIRKQRKYTNLPIIALTAKAMKDDRRKCIDAGADDYITKPVDVERLLSLMRVWMNK